MNRYLTIGYGAVCYVVFLAVRTSSASRSECR
jgi:hypothetical protein